MLATLKRPLFSGIFLLTCAAAAACEGDSVDPSNPDASNAKEASSESGSARGDGSAGAEGGVDGGSTQEGDATGGGGDAGASEG